MSVDGGQIYKALIFVVNVEQPVIFFQNVRNQRTVGLEFRLRIRGVAVNIGNGVEIGIVDHGFRLLALTGAAAQNRQRRP